MKLMQKIFLLGILLLWTFLSRAHVAVDYPVGGEVFMPGTVVTISWHIVIPHDTQNWDVYYSEDGGSSWLPIQIDVPSNQLSLDWEVPAIGTQTARILVIMDNSGTDCQAASGIFEISALPGNLVTKKLFINRGSAQNTSGAEFPALAFNSSGTFNPTNEILHFSKGDSLILTVVNNDTTYHNLAIDGIQTSSTPIAPGDSVIFGFQLSSAGVYRYYDSYSQGNSYLGLSGIMLIEESPGKHFFWNLREHEIAKNISLANGGMVDFTEFQPDYFFINGKSFPEIQGDPLAAVQGLVGDTINIFICNSGIMKHSIHFHGFHVKIKYSKKKPQMVDLIKDTVPLLAGEVMELELVPDKPGEYPVHDHNLVAITGGGEYPNGMLLIMSFE
jgi:hypothetical protein